MKSERYNTKVKTVDEYIALYPKDIATRLKTLRRLVRDIAPKAEESISYGMPAYKLQGPLAYFAAFEKHIGFYPISTEAFKKELSKYKIGKGSVQFPLTEPLPLPLIQKMVKYRMKENIKKK